MTIVQLNANDTGLYECIASNFVADIIATALLVVHSQSDSYIVIIPPPTVVAGGIIFYC